MAPNKKTKVDYSTALKAQADKMAPKQEQSRDKSKETFEAFVNGTKVTIVRGDSTDAEWEAAKQTVVDKATVSEEQRKAQEYYEETGSTKKLDALKGKPTPEQQRADKEAEKTPDQRRIEAEAAAAEKDKAQGYHILTSDEAKKFKERQKASESATPADGEGAGTLKNKIMSVLGDMFKGAVPPEAKTLPEMDLSQSLDPRGSNPALIEQAYKNYNTPSSALPPEPATSQAPQEAAQSEPSLGGFLKFGNAVASGAGPLTGMKPLSIADKQADIATAAQDPANAPVALPEVDLSQPQSVPVGNLASLAGAAPEGDSASMSASARVPGNAAMPVAPRDPLVDQINTFKDREKANLTASTELLQARQDEENKVVRSGMEKQARLQADAAAQEQAYQSEIKKHEDGLRDLMMESRQLSKESIDPNRFWNNKDAGQKAAAVIAGALFGFTGQGMQWLQRLDSLVAQDIQAQSADLNRRRGYAQDQAGMQQNLVAMAERKGLRGKAASDAAMATLKSNIADELRLKAMDYANPELKLKSEQAAAAIEMSAQKEISQVGISAQERAMKQRLNLAQIHNLEAQAYAARLSADNKGAKGGSPLPEAGVKALDGYAESLQVITQMKKLAENTGWQSRASQKAKQMFPLGEAEEKAKMNQFEAQKNTWMTGKAKGALQKEEVERLSPLLGSRGQVAVDPVPNLQLAAKLALEQFDRAIASHAGKGFDVSRFVEERNKLAADIGGGGSAPGYAEGVE